MSLAQAIERHLGEAQQAKQAGDANWWKIHEAVMLSLGSCQEVIESHIKAGSVKFDLGMFLENVVMANIASPGK